MSEPVHRLTLSDGQTALIDAELYEKPLIYFHRGGRESELRICDKAWRLTRGSKWQYPATTIQHSKKKSVLFLHRLVMGAKSGEQIDHINGDRLDARRENLRFCETWQNIANMTIRNDRGSSKFKGVHYDAQDGRWRASISFHGRKINIGDYASERDAAIAYNTAAKLLFGGFARLNDIEVT